MASLTYPSESADLNLLQQVRYIISHVKGIARHQLRATTDLLCEFGLEALDMVDIILAVESYFHLTIPDEVPLRTPGDFVQYLHQQLPPPCPALRTKRRAQH
jgi:acyl carrier protein